MRWDLDLNPIAHSPAWDDFEWLPLSGCGTQHPHRALGGTRVLLAAAPTTPPCFRRWWRSSSLRSGHIQRKEYFIICSSGKSADFPELPFHGWGRKGRWHICPFPCALLCESQIQKRPQAFLHKNKNRGTQVVKLSVPFLFSLRRLWYQTQPVPRRKLQSKPCCRFP